MQTHFYSIIKFLALTSLPLFFYNQQAQAGSDPVCAPVIGSLNNTYDNCNNFPILTPSNDNETNIALLLSDLGLAKIKFADADSKLWTAVYGPTPFEVGTVSLENSIPNQRKIKVSDNSFSDEHCGSISSGAAQFIQQVQNNKNIPANEKTILINERKKQNNCDSKFDLITVQPSWTKTTQQYASYLNANIAFYNTNFSTATKIYTVISQVEDPWIKETAQYMLIRSSLNTAYITGRSEYGDIDFKKINQNLLNEFFNHITAYFKLYPNGQYIASARGFLRRGLWLANKPELLVNEYVWQINNPKSPVYNLEMGNIAYEIDQKVLLNPALTANKLSDPFFLALYDLMNMRASDRDGYQPITWSQLNAQKDHFKKNPELFQYLLANHLYFIQKKPNEALKLLNQVDPSHFNNYLQLSSVYLKGNLLEATNQLPAAEQFWKTALSQAKTATQSSLFENQLIYILSLQNKQNEVLNLFPKIKQANLQKAWISQIADANSLDKIINGQTFNSAQKNAALYVLLNQSLTYQDYSLFNKAQNWLPKDANLYKADQSNAEKYKDAAPLSKFIWNGTQITTQIKCPNLATITANLQQQPKDLNAQLCLGEYARNVGIYSIDPFDSYTEASFSIKKTAFHGTTFARGNTYKNIIKSMPNGELKAYALYRAIQCYAPSGANDCQDEDVAKSVRKQWFDQIRRDYPNTSWAKSLKYYW